MIVIDLSKAPEEQFSKVFSAIGQWGRIQAENHKKQLNLTKEEENAK